MTTQKKLGFGGQWVDLFKTGRHVGKDDQGKDVTVDVTAEFLEAVSSNYDPKLHEAPACIGHPENDAPAYGWVAGLRTEGETLQAQFADTDPGFEQIVNDGRYKKRSPKFYLDEKGCGKFPYLRHVAWLGAAPPAVKGMRDVQRHAQFSETEGDTVAFEIEFSEGDKPVTQPKKDEKSISEQIAEFLREKFGAKEDKPAAASFSEADAQALIEKAVKPLSEKITSLETENNELKTQVAGIGTNSSRAELVSFCETLESNGTLPRAFRNMGGVEFLEAVASLPADKKVTTIEFAEKDGKQVEEKKDIAPLDFAKKFLSSLRYVTFGEDFGRLQVTGDGSDVTNPGEMDMLRGVVGLPKSTDKAKA